MLIRVPINETRWVLTSNDYEAGELITHAEDCLDLLGHSQLARALINDVKPHNALGATMLGLDYPEFERRFAAKDKHCKDARQASKPANFGFPGGMGEAKLVLQQRKQGPDTPCPNGPVAIDGKGNKGYRGLRFCIYMDGAERCGGPGNMVNMWGKPGNERPISPTCRACLQCAARLRAHWFATWPENREYFKLIAEYVERGMPLPDGSRLAPGEVRQLFSDRVRGGVEFTNGANGFFQARLAEAAKQAFWQVQRECLDVTYRVPRMMFPNSLPWEHGAISPLIGSRAIALQHDEIMAEHPRPMLDLAARRVAHVMVDWLRHVCPRTAKAVHVAPAAMLIWYKSAETSLDADGGLAPWWPSHEKACPACGVKKGIACLDASDHCHPERDALLAA